MVDRASRTDVTASSAGWWLAQRPAVSPGAHFTESHFCPVDIVVSIFLRFSCTWNERCGTMTMNIESSAA